MEFAYNKHYFPPIPSFEIYLGTPGESLAIGPLSAIVDSGADMTLVPLHHVRPLLLQVDDHRLLRSHWGEHRRVPIYSLDIGIGSLTLPAVEVIGDSQGEEIIIGRNILNKLAVTLDGPKLRVLLGE